MKLNQTQIHNFALTYAKAFILGTTQEGFVPWLKSNMNQAYSPTSGQVSEMVELAIEAVRLFGGITKALYCQTVNEL